MLILVNNFFTTVATFGTFSNKTATVRAQLSTLYKVKHLLHVLT